MKRICAWCGKEFECTNGKKKVCDDVHYANCEVCGKPFVVPNSMLFAKDRRRTCSAECRRKLRESTNIDRYGGVAPACSKEVRDKMEATNLERFGVKHAAQSDVCKQKSKDTNLAKYGVEHHSQTAEGRKAVSDRFKDEEYRNTVRSHTEATNLSRYGVKSTLSVPEVRERARQTYKDRTGYDTPFANPEVREKSKSTWMKTLGVDHPMRSNDIQARMKESFRQHYGKQNIEGRRYIEEKTRETMRKRYSVDYYLQSAEGRKKLTDALESKYGVPHFSMSQDWKSKRIKDSDKVQNLMQFHEDPLAYIQTTFKEPPSLKELCDSVGCSGTSDISKVLKEHNCQDAIVYVYSNMEREMYQFLMSIDRYINVERNTHQIITPYEIDLYLPDYKLGIECNPTSTHNSSINVFDKHSSATPESYHQMKTDMCDKVGVRLIHVFGYEWNHKREIIESIIRNAIGANTDKIYARKTEIREVSDKASKEFLNANHRQGYVPSKIRLGLYYADKLVSLMTFGKSRSTIGGDADTWEMYRFCNTLNTSVVGGASKLFKHFMQDVNPSRIISFSDRAHTTGRLYQMLGFHELRRSKPGYVWVDAITDIAYNRVNAQKKNINRFLHDSDIDLSKSESEIMLEHGFVKMYDSGTITWEIKQ